MADTPDPGFEYQPELCPMCWGHGLLGSDKKGVCNVRLVCPTCGSLGPDTSGEPVPEPITLPEKQK